MSKKIAVLLADGFEETEAVVPADVWTRVGFDVVLVGVEELCVRGAHDIIISADCLINDLNPDEFDCVFLPGGMPGALNLKQSSSVLAVVRNLFENGLVSAICAAPIALAQAGILDGKTVTCYPGFEDQLGKIEYADTLTAVDGNVITGKGPGAVFELSTAVASALGEKQEVEKVLKGMIV